MRIVLPILILFVLLAGCSGSSSLQPDLSTPFGRLSHDIAVKFDDPAFDNAHWGVLIRSLKTGETVCARNEKKMFMPASNMKLFSTAAMMTVLGKEYRYTTTLVALGSVKDSVLNGDLMIVGSGDPSLGAHFFGSPADSIFRLWADSLRAHGIASVNGRIIGNDQSFDDEYYGNNWSADDETWDYSAQFGGIIFNDNVVDLHVAAARPGEICSLTVSPATKFVNVINRTMTAAVTDSVNDIDFLRVRGTNTIIITGRLSAGKKPVDEGITVDNPTLFAATVLKEKLESSGIRVTGAPIDADDLVDTVNVSGKPVVATYLSPAYTTIAAETNKPSQNLYAEQAIRTVGKEKTGLGSLKNGKRSAYPIFASWGVDTVRLRMADGSGLSRMDLITPSDAVAVLTGMYNSPNYPEFYASLPIAGVDGTLKNRMKGTAAAGNVHAKTGTIGYVRALSGYVTSAEGEPFVFSMIVNHYTAPLREADKIQNDVCAMLAGFSRNQKNP